MTTSSYESLTHSKWDCKYHIVFISKGRKKVLYGKVRKYLGPVFHELAGQRGATIVEGNMVKDHVHMMIKIPPKYSVAEVVGYLKGKSAIAVARQFGGRQKNFNGERLWARGMQSLLWDLKKRRLGLISNIRSSLTEVKAAKKKERFDNAAPFRR